MIEIDGSYLEGGGQIVRTALALSVLTGKPFRVDRIRSGRPKPGLKQQHLTGVNILKEMCNARVKGDALGSMSLEFAPGGIVYKNLDIDIKTAGSITLLLQALMPVLVFSDKPIRIQVKGGTDVSHSPSIDYLINVFLPQMRRYCEYEASIQSRGYYPKGGGLVQLRISPGFRFGDRLPGIELINMGKPFAVMGVSHASKDLMKGRVAERMAKTAEYLLGSKAHISIEYSNALSTGCGLTLWRMFSDKDEMDFKNPVVLGVDALGSRGVKAEDVGRQAARQLQRQSAPVDEHMADQLLIFLALSGGKIRVPKLTQHARTNIYAIERFLDVKFKTEKDLITCSSRSRRD